MKKLISILLILSMLCSMLPLAAFSDEAETEHISQEKLVPDLEESDWEQQGDSIDPDGTGEPKVEAVITEEVRDETVIKEENEKESAAPEEKEEFLADSSEEASEPEPLPEPSPYTGWTDGEILDEYIRLLEENNEDVLNDFFELLSPSQQEALATALISQVGAASVQSDLIAKGTCGSLVWELDSEGVFTLSGTGTTGNFRWDNTGIHTPWADVAQKILTIVINDGVTELGENAFGTCAATSISLPATLKVIGRFALPGGLQELQIPNGVESIDLSSGLAIQTIDIPASVKELSLWNCNDLRRITVAQGNSVFKSVDDVLFNKAGTVLICYPSLKKEASYTIPEGVERIQTLAFTNCKYLKEVVFPDTLRVLESFAFNSCNSIESFFIPAGVTTMANRALSANAKSISVSNENMNFSAVDGVLFNKAGTELIQYPLGKNEKCYTVPESVRKIGDEAFSGNWELEEVIIPKTVTEIGQNAFSGCRIISAKIKGNQVKIDRYAFSYCEELQKIYFTGNRPVMDATAFTHVPAVVYYPQDNSSWNSFDFQNYGGGVTWMSYILPDEDLPREGELGENLYWKLDDDGTLMITGFGGMYWNGWETPWYRLRSAVRKVVIEQGVTSVAAKAFAECFNLRSAELPISVNHIWDGAFADCTSLQSVTIPGEVYSIGENAFANCKSLSTVHFQVSVSCTIAENAFANTTAMVYNYGNAVSSANRGDYGGQLTWQDVGDPIQDFRVNVPEILAPGFESTVSVYYTPGTAQAVFSFKVENPEIVMIQSSETTRYGAYCGIRAMKSGTTTVVVTEQKTRISKSVPVSVVMPETIPTGMDFETQLEVAAQTQTNLYGERPYRKFYSFIPAQSGTYCMTVTKVNELVGGDVVSGDVAVMCGESFVEASNWNYGKTVNSFTFDLQAGVPYILRLNYLAADEMQESVFSIHKSDGVSDVIPDFWVNESKTVIFWPERINSEYLSFEKTDQKLEWSTDRTDIIDIKEISDYSLQFDALKPGKAFIYCRGENISKNIPIEITEAVPMRVNSNLYLNLQASGISGKGVYFTAPEDGTYCFTAKRAGGNQKFYTNYSSTSGQRLFSQDDDDGFICYYVLKQGQWVELALYSDSFTGLLSLQKCSDTPADIALYVVRQSEDELAVGVSFAPTNGAVSPIVRWQSGDESLCKLRSGGSQIGGFSICGEGDVTITATAANGKTGSISLHVGQCLNGHEFGAWEDADGTLFLPGQALQKKCRNCDSRQFITIYPNQIHTLSFDAAGGSGAPENRTKYAGIPLTIPEAVPVRPCYTFAGWASSPDSQQAGYRPGDNFPENVDTTLYALWQPMPNCLNAAELIDSETDKIYVDGREVAIGENGEIFLDTLDGSTLVVCGFHNGASGDVHSRYPVSMKVYFLRCTGDFVTAEYVPEFDNILQYAGSSIRITGNKGIRMITSIDMSKKSALVGNGLAEFKLAEYGTLLAQTSKLENKPLVLGGENVKSNYAYKRGVADPVFNIVGDVMQYTNVLVGFTDEQCSEDIAMRPYMIVEDTAGNRYTIYGGTVYRSIGYIAYQNRRAFTPNSTAYNYVWSIIHSVYGNRFDADSKV